MVNDVPDATIAFHSVYVPATKSPLVSTTRIAIVMPVSIVQLFVEPTVMLPAPIALPGADSVVTVDAPFF